jgi:hypothetical protein
MAIKKSTNPVRPGRGEPGGPPNPSKVKVSSGLTVLGKVDPKSLAGNRKPLSSATVKELKAMLAKIEAAKAAAAKSSKKDAKIIKQQNKPKSVLGGSSKPKPVIEVKPSKGGRGMGGGLGGGIFGTKNR